MDLITQEICDAVCEEPDSLQFVPDYFVRLKLVDMWHNDEDYCNDDELAEWHNGYKKCKALKKTD